MRPRGPCVVAVVGPSCSGKSTECEKLKKALGSKCTIISQDNYYFSAKHGDNFDVPQALDFKRLRKDLKTIKRGQAVNIPQYDFKEHKRLDETKLIEPNDVIIIEGILLFCDEKLLNLFDIKVYIKSDESSRECRRLIRDVSERGRTLDYVKKQYEDHVIPSNKIYVEPSQKHADHLLIDNADYTFQGEAELLTKINQLRGFIVEQKN